MDTENKMDAGNDDLPCGFDLLYDLKSKQELVDELEYLTTRLESLLKMVHYHKVSLEGVVPSGDK